MDGRIESSRNETGFNARDLFSRSELVFDSEIPEKNGKADIFDQAFNLAKQISQLSANRNRNPAQFDQWVEIRLKNIYQKAFSQPTVSLKKFFAAEVLQRTGLRNRANQLNMEFQSLSTSLQDLDRRASDQQMEYNRIQEKISQNRSEHRQVLKDSVLLDRVSKDGRDRIVNIIQRAVQDGREGGDAGEETFFRQEDIVVGVSQNYIWNGWRFRAGFGVSWESTSSKPKGVLLVSTEFDGMRKSWPRAENSFGTTGFITYTSKRLGQIEAEYGCIDGENFFTRVQLDGRSFLKLAGALSRRETTFLPPFSIPIGVIHEKGSLYPYIGFLLFSKKKEILYGKGFFQGMVPFGLTESSGSQFEKGIQKTEGKDFFLKQEKPIQFSIEDFGSRESSSKFLIGEEKVESLKINKFSESIGEQTKSLENLLKKTSKSQENCCRQLNSKIDNLKNTTPKGIPDEAVDWLSHLITLYNGLQISNPLLALSVGVVLGTLYLCVYEISFRLRNKKRNLEYILAYGLRKFLGFSFISGVFIILGAVCYNLIQGNNIFNKPEWYQNSLEKLSEKIKFQFKGSEALGALLVYSLTATFFVFGFFSTNKVIASIIFNPFTYFGYFAVLSFLRGFVRYSNFEFKVLFEDFFQLAFYPIFLTQYAIEKTGEIFGSKEKLYPELDPVKYGYYASNFERSDPAIFY